MKPVSTGASILSGVSVVGATAASLTTLFWPGAFPPHGTTSSVNQILAEAQAWSLATLVFAVPALLVGLRAARRGSLRGHLLWLGSLAYLLYTYLEFSVSPPFSALFLVYVGTYTCALAALVSGLFALDLERMASAFAAAPRKGVAVFLLVLGFGLAFSWLNNIVRALLSHNVGWPEGEAAVRHVVYALDLGLQVPLAIAAGALLWRGRSGGYVAAAIMLVNSALMSAALTLMVALPALGSGSGLTAAIPFGVLFIITSGMSLVFFRVREGHEAPRYGFRPRNALGGTAVCGSRVPTLTKS